MSDTIITDALVASWYKHRLADTHKGDYGRALLVAGSHGMMGAALLSARACMRSGVGLLTTRVPSCGYGIMQLGIPEAKCECDICDTHHTKIVVPHDTEVIGIGPGLGLHQDTHNALHQLLLDNDLPLVVDADALNILALHPEWLSLVPRGSILTPHPGEMKRLGGDAQSLVDKFGVIVVLKGYHTEIYSAHGKYMNSLHGNPGMAVGGSGDVLTGIILALLSQHYNPLHAACMGVWLHAYAADIALEQNQSHESLLPSDVISHVGLAFNRI